MLLFHYVYVYGDGGEFMMAKMYHYYFIINLNYHYHLIIRFNFHPIIIIAFNQGNYLSNLLFILNLLIFHIHHMGLYPLEPFQQ